ncbi:MAG: glycosyltransferase family 4 protein [Candidatus Bathyarchaeota archaeon]|nr:glycosyltransferase family 4 protein [Candidatus Bathyarchaeota archaeon]
MKIIILSWEFPPRIVGEMAIYVNSLASNLARKGFNVYVVTYHDSLNGLSTCDDGVKVFRVNNPVIHHTSILTWSLTLNGNFEKAVVEILEREGTAQTLIDAHEWLTISAAVSLKKTFDIPLIFTLHTIEDYRSNYSETPLSVAIKSLEWLGMYVADKIVVRSENLKKDLCNLYRVPEDKIRVVDWFKLSSWIEDIVLLYKELLKT